MPSREVRKGLVVDLELQSVLNEIPLLFSAPTDKYSAAFNIQAFRFDTCCLGKVEHALAFRGSMRGFTSGHLFGGTDIANFSDSEVTVVIGNAMRVRHST